MTQRCTIPLLLLVLVAISSVSLLAEDVPRFGVQAGFGGLFPLGDSASLFDSGMAGQARGIYAGKSGLGASIDVLYGGFPLIDGRSLTFFDVSAGPLYTLPLPGDFALRGGGTVGVFRATLENGAADTALSADIGAALLYRKFFPFALALEGDYVKLFGLYDGLKAGLSLSYTFAPTEKTQTTPKAPVATEARGFHVGSIEVDEIFPVFYKRYNDTPFGTVTLVNNGAKPVTDLVLGFNMKQFMDSPRLMDTIASIAPGARVDIPVYALFADRILEVTEGTLVAADFSLSYKIDGKDLSLSQTKSLRIVDRNGMSWFDDRCAAAFVTAKDPAILNFAKNVVGTIQNESGFTMNRNFQTAVALNSALALYGISYIVDPKSSYASLSQNMQAVDFLQFPRQTLEYRSGDCDDLTILYAALLESAGVETAFITVPGHIFLAFSLDLPDADARRLFPDSTDVIYRDGRSWIPLEATEIKGGFLRAWQSGSNRWREHAGRGDAKFLPVHQAWTVFEPVGLPGTAPRIETPAGKALLQAYSGMMDAILSMTVAPQEARLLKEINLSQNAPRSINALGILYSRYGLYEKAKERFSLLASGKQYPPAMVNMGNIEYLSGENRVALEWYGRAHDIQAGNTGALAGLIQTNYAVGAYALAQDFYKELEKADPAAAAKYAYVRRSSGDVSRASGTTTEKDGLIWSE